MRDSLFWASFAWLTFVGGFLLGACAHVPHSPCLVAAPEDAGQLGETLPAYSMRVECPGRGVTCDLSRRTCGCAP